EPHENTGNPVHGRGCSRSHRLRHRVDERADDLTGSHAAGVGGSGCGLGEALGNGLRDLLETRGDPRPHTVKRGVHRVAEGALLACDPSVSVTPNISPMPNATSGIMVRAPRPLKI